MVLCRPRRRARSRAAAFLAAVLAIAPAGCRDGAAPFEARDRSAEGPAPVWRLTYSVVEDRAPTWSASGDSVLYTTEGFDHLPSTNGVLVVVPRDGGVTRPLLPSIQRRTGTTHWLMTPTVSPDGTRVLFTEVRLWQIVDLCAIGRGALIAVCGPDEWQPTVPRIGAVAIRVRPFATDRRLGDDPGLRVAVADTQIIRDPNVPPGFLPRVEFMRREPFRMVFEEDRTFYFRPSWGPAGERVVVSDGLGLSIWRPGADSAVAVPNTGGGISPAWSPDGEWIAFSALERGDSTVSRCAVYTEGFLPFCVADQVVYDIGRRALVLIRPDGGDRRELVEGGEEPAWAPDGRTIFFRRDGRIWRIAADGEPAEPVAHTERGREPAVSPDGRFLAFARGNERGDHDIWVVSLESSQ